MIKINLASRKQSGGMAAGDAGAGGSLSKLKFDTSLIKELPLRKILAPIVAAVVVSFLFDNYKADELEKVSAVLSKLTAQRTQLQVEVGKMKGYEERKKAIDADELILRSKIETIQKLIAERGSPSKILLSLASATPKDVWLSEFRIHDQDVTFKGYSLGFNQISDFMKNLGESAFFSDLNVRNTQQAKDEVGAEIASFELTARRR